MADGLLGEVLHQYESSGDFNGLYLTGENSARLTEAATLVRDGLLEVVSDENFLNPHIRPWPSRRDRNDQLSLLRRLVTSGRGVCLYPTVAAIAAHPSKRTYYGEPYRRALADGRGALELAYFRFDVIEQYRNDPRYNFRYLDFGAEAGITDDAYWDANEIEDDKTSIQYLGYAYDLSKYVVRDPESPIIRLICAFLRDLAGLTPTHQQRWKTYEILDTTAKPHPVWWNQMMGQWPDGNGPFQEVFVQLRNISELHSRAFGEPLFNALDRPDDFGWVLRPSQQEWDRFVQQLDKMLSENIRHAALDAAGAPRKDQRGQTIGTLNRLGEVLRIAGNDAASIREVLAPLREIRRARQAPAHSLRSNVVSKTFIHQQVDLLERLNASLSALRQCWQTHPSNQDWRPDSQDGEIRYRM